MKTTTVHFYHDNDPIPAESIIIDDTYYAVMGSDLWIGRLKSAPSSAVKRYPLIKRPEGTNYAGIDDIDLKLYLVGVRGATLEYGEAQSRVGLNDIAQHYGDHLYFTYDFGQRGVDEARIIVLRFIWLHHSSPIITQTLLLQAFTRTTEILIFRLLPPVLQPKSTTRPVVPKV